MTWGARIKNTSGIIQIDEFYRNLALRHTGTFADLSYVGTYIGATETAYIFSVTRACSVPVVAVSPGKDTNQRRFRCQRVVNNGNGTYTFYFYISGSNSTVGDNRWYIFDYPVESSLAPAWAIRFRNSAGALSFDSRYRYMKVLPDQSARVPGAKRYAFHEVGIYAEFASEDLGNGQWASLMYNVAIGWDAPNSRYYSIAMETWSQVGNSSVISPTRFNNQWLVLDVTGY